jgi:hypothetical protein
VETLAAAVVRVKLDIGAGNPLLMLPEVIRQQREQHGVVAEEQLLGQSLHHMEKVLHLGILVQVDILQAVVVVLAV